jgi:glutamine synthetase
MTRAEIRKSVESENLAFIYLQFSDLLGQPKNVVINAEKLEDVLESGLWFDGSSVEGFGRLAESDMLLKPDLDTFAIIPWSPVERKAGRLICQAFKPSGRPLPADPRQILQRMLAKAQEKGLTYLVGAEFEFYLFERGALPQLQPHDDKSYFDYTPHSRAAEICEQTMKSLSAFGIKSEMHHHEVGMGQHEIDIRFDHALKSADNIFAVKMALKAHTANTELKAAWLPKPIFGFPGNGLHTHQSLWKAKKNVFYDQNGQYGLSKLALHFLAGQLYHARALSAIVSPTVNSYKRLVSGYEAPVYICWGQTNRSALMRIPRSSEDKATAASRMEYRAPDPSANPYLVFAGLLAAGLDGIERKILPPAAIEDNVYEFDGTKLKENHIEILPANLGEAIEALEKDPVILDIFGPVKDRYLEIKKEEWRQFSTQVTPWEIERYL